MPLHKFRAGRALLELLVILLIGLTPVGCGLLIMTWQVEKMLAESTQVSIQHTVQDIDRILDSLHNASNKVLNLADFPCQKALPSLRTEVAMRPELRSLVLVRENRAYCSTVYGEYQLLVYPGSFFNLRLRLEAGNNVTPDSAILYYRLQEYPLGVLALVDAKTLQTALQRIKAKANLVLQFGDDYLWSDGHTFDEELPDHAEQHVRVVSATYGYAVHGGYPAGYIWQTMTSNAQAIIPSLLLVGVMTSAAVYWTLFRNRRIPQARRYN